MEKGANPLLSLRGCFPIELISQRPKVLFDMMQIDPLHGVFESILGNTPNPDGSIAQDQNDLGHAQTTLKGLGIELPLKAIQSPSRGYIAALSDNGASRSRRAPLV